MFDFGFKKLAAFMVFAGILTAGSFAAPAAQSEIVTIPKADATTVVTVGGQAVDTLGPFTEADDYVYEAEADGEAYTVTVRCVYADAEETDLLAELFIEKDGKKVPVIGKYVRTLTFEPSGGSWDGSTEPVTLRIRDDSVIRVYKAPEREGFTFVEWRGSSYQPGDLYTVSEDHKFTAIWKKDEAKPDGGSGSRQGSSGNPSGNTNTGSPAANPSGQAGTGSAGTGSSGSGGGDGDASGTSESPGGGTGRQYAQDGAQAGESGPAAAPSKTSDSTPFEGYAALAAAMFAAAVVLMLLLIKRTREDL